MASNLNKRTLDRKRGFAEIFGAAGDTDARFEQDGLYFAADDSICNRNRMRPKEGEDVKPYHQKGQKPVPAAIPFGQESMVTTMVDGREVQMTVAELTAMAAENDPEGGTYTEAAAGDDGAMAVAELDWQQVRRAASHLEIPGAQKDKIFGGFEERGITHVRLV